MKPFRLAVFAVPALCAATLLWSFAAPGTERGFDVAGFGALPVLDNGRIKPVDTVARTALLELCGKQVVRDANGRSLDALHWFLEAAARSDDANRLEVFEIDDPDVTGLLGIQTESRRRFAFKELEPKLDEIERQAQAADRVPDHERSRFQRNILRLHESVYLYRRLQNTLRLSDSGDFAGEVGQYVKVLPAGIKALAAHQHGGKIDRQALSQLGAFFDRYRELDEIAAFRPLPPVAGEGPDEWASVGRGLLDALQTGAVREGTLTWFAALAAWADHDAAGFNAATAEIRARDDLARPDAVRSAGWEVVFNRVAPFYQGMVFYVIALLLVAAAWTGARWGEEARRAAFGVFALAFAVHTAGLLTRIVLQGRPPVTNLYSSAVYVGWVAVLLGLALERRARDGIALAVASAIGFATLLIAHHLSLSGEDSMEMMRAVLDSNFWLATHVTSVTTGYASTFLAGSLAIWYILRGVFARSFAVDEARAVGRMTYGVVCFALFFSFTGTVLGGIWADQSWGRFWGWDPKENGALLIVLWNAILLHVRWGRMVTERELMSLVVFGNVVTALSWFGVNMLGIGLHSYGFMDKAFVWLVAFCVVQIAIIAAGLMPLRYWRGARGVADR